MQWKTPNGHEEPYYEYAPTKSSRVQISFNRHVPSSCDIYHHIYLLNNIPMYIHDHTAHLPFPHSSETIVFLHSQCFCPFQTPGQTSQYHNATLCRKPSARDLSFEEATITLIARFFFLSSFSSRLRSKSLSRLLLHWSSSRRCRRCRLRRPFPPFQPISQSLQSVVLHLLLHQLPHFLVASDAGCRRGAIRLILVLGGSVERDVGADQRVV